MIDTVRSQSFVHGIKTMTVCHHFLVLAFDSGNDRNLGLLPMAEGWGDFDSLALDMFGFHENILQLVTASQSVVSRSATSLKVWNLGLGLSAAKECNVATTACCLDGPGLICGTETGEIARVPIHSSRSGGELEWRSLFVVDSAISCLSARGTRLFAGRSDGFLQVFDTESAQSLHCFQAHGSPLLHLEFYHDFVVSCDTSTDGQINFWLPDGTLVKSLQSFSTSCIAIHGERVFSGNGALLLEWDLDHDEALVSLESHSETLGITSLFVAQGYLISGGLDGKLQWYRLEPRISPAPEAREVADKRLVEQLKRSKEVLSKQERMHLRAKGELAFAKQEIASLKAELAKSQKQAAHGARVQIDLNDTKLKLASLQLELERTKEACRESMAFVLSHCDKQLEDSARELQTFQKLFKDDSALHWTQSSDSRTASQRQWKFDADWDADNDPHITWWRASDNAPATSFVPPPIPSKKPGLSRQQSAVFSSQRETLDDDPPGQKTSPTSKKALRRRHSVSIFNKILSSPPIDEEQESPSTGVLSWSSFWPLTKEQ
ncbi:hypothetical protein HDU91_000495 [Kappamyces sp. JEL0680]|nr:hypothetical protein HDU91_000495 [Kappamyces sp. JEL0680]